MAKVPLSFERKLLRGNVGYFIMMAWQIIIMPLL